MSKQAEKEVKDNFLECANLIENGLYLGSEDAGHMNINILKKYNISSILVCGFGISMIHAANEINYMRIKAIDLPIYDISKDLKVAIQFIENNIDIKNKKCVLVHCSLGKSRSASIVIA